MYTVFENTLIPQAFLDLGLHPTPFGDNHTLFTHVVVESIEATYTTPVSEDPETPIDMTAAVNEVIVILDSREYCALVLTAQHAIAVRNTIMPAPDEPEAAPVNIPNVPLQPYKDMIDREAGERRDLFVSVGHHTTEEYRLAQKAAETYAAGGYTGVVPEAVQSWMDVSGMNATDATNQIIGESAWLEAELNRIRRIRLEKKAELEALETPSREDCLVVVEAAKAAFTA